MRIEYGNIIALGYGKYFKSDSIIGLVPIEDDRGPGRRTCVYVTGQPEPIVASRSDVAADYTGARSLGPGSIGRAD